MTNNSDDLVTDGARLLFRRQHRTCPKQLFIIARATAADKAAPPDRCPTSLVTSPDNETAASAADVKPTALFVWVVMMDDQHSDQVLPVRLPSIRPAHGSFRWCAGFDWSYSGLYLIDVDGTNLTTLVQPAMYCADGRARPVVARWLADRLRAMGDEPVTCAVARPRHRRGWDQRSDRRSSRWCLVRSAAWLVAGRTAHQHPAEYRAGRLAGPCLGTRHHRPRWHHAGSSRSGSSRRTTGVTNRPRTGPRSRSSRRMATATGFSSCSGTRPTARRNPPRRRPPAIRPGNASLRSPPPRRRASSVAGAPHPRPSPVRPAGRRPRPTVALAIVAG